MPVDRTHAFASGRVYGEPAGLDRIRQKRIAAVWRSFRANATLGSNCLLGPNAWCANDGSREAIRLGDRVVCRAVIRRENFGNGLIAIGDDVYLGDDCILSSAARIEVGGGTLLGHGVQIFDNNSHPVDGGARRADWDAIRTGSGREQIASDPVIIGENVWIGFGAVVLKGVTIGDDAIIGAASVVTADVRAGATVAGNPARPT
jgi:acetyltransferase-like isoleucine patch superfamily enzyme